MTRPRRAKTSPILACLQVMRMAIGRVIVTPIPTAEPFMAAMTGFLHWCIAMVSLPPLIDLLAWMYNECELC